MLNLSPCHCNPLSFIGGYCCTYLSSFYFFLDIPLGPTTLNLSHLMGLNETMMKFILLNSLIIHCSMVMVVLLMMVLVVLVMLVVEAGQIPLQVS